MAAGMVLAKIVVDRAYGPLGLTKGVNYLWVDRKGSAKTSWRAIMIGMDGSSRYLLRNFAYTPDAAHPGPGGPADHARLYCNGAKGCFVKRLLSPGQSVTDGIWMRCPNGCCQIG
jgi:hypothetical protein